MTIAAEPQSTQSWKPSPMVLGTVCCMLSALCYTAANICMRHLAGKVDPAWVICIKESVAVAVVGPWLIVQIARGRRYRFPLKGVAALIAIGMAVQLLGNLPVQWAFGVVGLAISMACIFGTMLAASALIGVSLLGERMTMRSKAAVLLLVVSILTLCVGLQGEEEKTGLALQIGSGHPLVFAGLGAACLGGLMYAGLGATIRYASNARVSVPVTVVLVTGMGTLVLGPLCAAQRGIGPLISDSQQEFLWAWMLGSGVFNLAAFLLITKGLQLTSLVHANVLNASQVALGALAGVFLFHETMNGWLAGGIALTILGITLIGAPQQPEEVV